VTAGSSGGNVVSATEALPAHTPRHEHAWCPCVGKSAGAVLPWLTSALAAAWCECVTGAGAAGAAAFVSATAPPCIGHGGKTPGSPTTRGNQTARQVASARNHGVRRIAYDNGESAENVPGRGFGALGAGVSVSAWGRKIQSDPSNENEPFFSPVKRRRTTYFQ